MAGSKVNFIGNPRRDDIIERIKKKYHLLQMACAFASSGVGTRTPDSWIMIPLLYQLSYAAKKNVAINITSIFI
jgi:hypothetical protein